MSTHTKGPWTVTFDETGGYDCMTKGWHVRSGDEPVVTVDDADGPNGEANALLIAAAPALLEALQELLDASPTGFGNDRRLNDAQRKAEALLKENL